jgi:hypothetical protein
MQKIAKCERDLLEDFWKIRQAVLLSDEALKHRFGRIMA